MNVTNGTVTFGRTTKPGDYEAKKVEVALSFAIAEGEDAESVVAQVGLMAQQRAMVMLGLPERAPAPAAVAEEPAKPRGRPAKLPIIIGGPKPEPAADPTTLTDAAPTQAPAAVSNGAAVPDPASLTEVPGDEWAAEPDPKPISDKELIDAIGRRNAEIKNAAKIRELIGKYVAFPGTARDITQDKRAGFVAELGSL